MKVVVVTNVDELRAMNSGYEALLERVGGMEQLYYSIDYIEASRETFGALGASMFFIVVLEDDSPELVLPFQLLDHRAHGLKSTLRFWGECNLYTHNIFEKFLAEGFRPDLLDAVVDSLNGELRKQWDTLEFTRIKAGEQNVHYFVSRFRHVAESAPNETYFYYDASVPLDELLGSKRLKNLRRCKRHLEEQFGAVEFVVKESIDAHDLEEIEQVHTLRQRQKEGTFNAFFCDPLEHRYIVELIHLWNTHHCVHYHSLRVGGKAIAINVMLMAPPVACSLIIAFDTEYAKYAPARILEYKAFRHTVERCGVTCIETGWGTNEFKKDYSTRTVELHDVHITNARFRSRIVDLATTKAAELSQTIRSHHNNAP